MTNFADRLIAAIQAKGTPCLPGIDPRLEQMPTFLSDAVAKDKSPEVLRATLTKFSTIVLEAIAPLAPAIKPQIAFFEQYGIPGLQALQDTLAMARDRRLLVIMDAKRNDISSTAQAYANTFLGPNAPFPADALTVSPYLGMDSLEPFIATAKANGKGLFVLVKTSNPGSGDLQDLPLKDSEQPLYLHLAAKLREAGQTMMGASGYSSLGAVVGATHPAQAKEIRAAMPEAMFIVPGYGAQGATAEAVMDGFNSDGLGGVVNSSRGLTFAFKDKSLSPEAYQADIRQRTEAMVEDLRRALGQVGK